ncbi:MAG: transcriptional repressor [Proteobacteria bacterium]|nr:transcriptional repressor [Pseudomonadota bacterium]MDE3209027.1 transcriptional repressor [Pseudomonadota bacterium]
MKLTLEERLALAEDHCRKRGSRLTPLRKEVLTLLMSHDGCVKAYDLLEEISRKNGGTAPPTVYRALDFLLAEGLAHRIDSLNTFAACHDFKDHQHSLLVVCSSCNSFTEIDDEEVSQILMDRLHGKGFSFNGKEVEIKALCNACHSKVV